MKLASGTAPVPALRRAGCACRPRHRWRRQQQRPRHVRVDAPGSLAAQARAWRPRTLPAADVLAMATRRGRGARNGADHRVARTRQAGGPDRRVHERREADPDVTILSHLVYATHGDDVKTTIVNGKILMREGKVLTLNEPAAFAEARKLSRRAAGGREMNVLLEADQIQRRIRSSRPRSKPTTRLTRKCTSSAC